MCSDIDLIVKAICCCGGGGGGDIIIHDNNNKVMFLPKRRLVKVSARNRLFEFLKQLINTWLKQNSKFLSS